MKRLIIATLLLFAPTLAYSADFFVDPIHGADSNDGSSASPWKSLQRLFDEGLIESRDWNKLQYTSASYLVPKNQGAPIKAGDTIYLRNGSYGEL